MLRITASLSFAMHHVAPLLREYTERYPNVRVHVEAANRYLDIIDNNIDVAIRTREMEPDSNITIRRLAETRRILVASPRYFSRHGTPKTLEDLQQHRLLIYTYANNPNELRFTRDGQVSTVAVKGLLESNDGQILRAAALDGMGILVQPSYIVFDDIVAGRLVPVLDAWDLPRLTINLAYPSRRTSPPRCTPSSTSWPSTLPRWITNASGPGALGCIEEKIEPYLRVKFPENLVQRRSCPAGSKRREAASCCVSVLSDLLGVFRSIGYLAAS